MTQSRFSLIQRIICILEDKKGIDLLLLDVRGISSYTDFLILCSGTSTTHVNALVSAIRDQISKPDAPVYINPSKDDSWWILDFVDLVLHVFRQDTRLYYNLETLWADAKTLPLPR